MRKEKLTVRTPAFSGELYLPVSGGLKTGRCDAFGEEAGACAGKGDKACPALVIMPSSAGVCDTRERFYAGYFAAQGFLCLVVDVFGPRGLTECLSDQAALGQAEMLKDARAALAWLNARGDAGAVGILGVSKGGSVALHAAMDPMPGLPPASGAFAFHVCLCPSCAVQLRRPRVTGAPMLMLLGGRDDYTGVEPALAYAARIAEGGGAPVETVLFPEACHAWESRGRLRYFPEAECYADCLFYLEDDGAITHAASGERMSAEAFRQRQRSLARFGAHAGGGTNDLRSKTCESILAFLRKHGFVPENPPCPLEGERRSR